MTQEENVTRPRAHNPSWYADQLVTLIQEPLESAMIEEGLDFVRRRRATDLQVVKGGFSLRIAPDKSRAYRVRLTMAPIPFKGWAEVVEQCAGRSGIIAALLNNELPEELVELCRIAQVVFVPSSASEFELSCDCGVRSDSCSHRAALSLVVADRLEKDPGLYLLFRGIERESLLQALRDARRRRARGRVARASGEGEGQLRYEQSKKLEEVVTSFWDAHHGFDSLHYDIRADDLPASLFRRLDPLPIGESSAAIEFALEDLYASVASRAQALGLGL